MRFPGLRRVEPSDAAPFTGLSAYSIQQEGGRVSVHLRLEEDGRGLLLINANRAVHLNPTAAYMAHLHLEGFSEPEATLAIRRRFRVREARAQADFRRFQTQLEEMVNPEGACPIHELDVHVISPFSQSPSAPYRMDLALTYRCNANCAHCYNARSRHYPELDTVQWRRVIDRLWDIGVPHICFTGGEATLRADLPQLIAHSSKRGQITGLLTNGRLISDRRLLRELVEAGLDHIQITLESHLHQVHDAMVAAKGAWEETVQGIRHALEADLYVMTNTTLLRENAPTILDTIDFLAGLGVPTVGCNALIYAGRGAKIESGIDERNLEPLLQAVRDRCDRHGQRLIWYTPTMYCHLDPVQLELGVKACTAARYNMCVEPDGAVLPCQSYYHPVGHILNDSWPSIWNHAICTWIRDRSYAPDECRACHFLPECGAGCPLLLQEKGQVVGPMLVMHPS